MTVNIEKLSQWAIAKQKSADASAEEMRLRKEIFGECWDKPVEGMNEHIPIGNGYVLKGTRKITRSLDEALYVEKYEELVKAGVPVVSVVTMKPTLSVKAYKALSEEHRKVFDQILDIKDGAPTLEIAKPA